MACDATFILPRRRLATIAAYCRSPALGRSPVETMFESILISNFRSCQSVQLDAGERVIALVGRNGAGKTNVLTAIKWLCESATAAKAVRSPDILYAENHDVAVDATLLIGGARYRYRLAYRSGTSGATPLGDSVEESLQNLDAARDLIKRDGENVSVFGKAEPIRIAAATPALAAMTSLLPQDDAALEPIRRLVEFFAGVHYYDLNEGVAGSQYVTREQYEAWRKAYEHDRSVTSSVAFRLLHMWENDRPAFDEVQEILRGLEVVNDIGVQSIDVGDTASDATKLYIFSFVPASGMGGHGRSFVFRDLSAGTRRIVRMIVSLIFDKRSVMLVEQPEDTIHRGMLLKVLDTFRTYTRATQLIFTTHSAAVLDMLSPAEVRLVSAEDGNTHVRKLTPDEIGRAGDFLNRSGNLSDFIESLEDDG